MNDRELLEAAAKAAGIQMEFNDMGTPGYWGKWRNLPQWEQWNPLTDDGDALRLAVKLRLLVDTDKQCVNGTYYGPGPDDYAATRRAIVWAAVDMGPAS